MARDRTSYGLTRRELSQFRAEVESFEIRRGSVARVGTARDRREASFLGRLCGSERVVIAVLRLRSLPEVAALVGLNLEVLAGAADLKPSGQDDATKAPLFNLASVLRWARTHASFETSQTTP